MINVVTVAAEGEQRTLLQAAVDGTAMARTVDMVPYPASPDDLLIRRIQDVNPGVIVVDISPESTAPALRALELLRSELPKAAIFAVGDVSQPQVIIHAMRAGAREFLQRPAHVNHVVEAFARLVSHSRDSKTTRRGMLFSVLDAKGGSGATTVAVNLATALQGLHGNTAIVDLAPLGHAALHLNVKPGFTVADAISNVHRLDQALLQSFMTPCASGLGLLAGPREPLAAELGNADFARLLSILLATYTYVVVDCSSRYDASTRAVCDLSDSVLLVAHADVVSLWSAAQVHNYLCESAEKDKVRLILNRFRRIEGFSDHDIEELTHTKLLWKVPNQYALVATSIDRGSPVTQRNHTELASSFVGLASALTGVPTESKRKTLSFFAGLRA